MENFIFDLQRFSQVTIAADDTYELDGVTYTAITDAVLNLDDDEKVSGLESGKVQATVTGSDDSPKVNLDATDSAINFSASGDGSVLTVKTLFPIEFISGEFTYKGNKLNIGVGATLAINNQRGNYALRNENTFEYGGTYTFTNTNLTVDSEHTDSTYTLTNGTDTRTLNLEAYGRVINNFAEQGFTLTKGSSEVLHIGDYTLTATAIDDAALNIDLNEKGLTLLPKQGDDGSLNISLTRGDTEILAGELECTSGSITLGYDNSITLAKGTSFDFKQANDYVLSVTATDAATTGISLTGNKISFTPGENDGGLNVVLKQGNTTLFGGHAEILLH